MATSGYLLSDSLLLGCLLFNVLRLESRWSRYISLLGILCSLPFAYQSQLASTAFTAALQQLQLPSTVSNSIVEKVQWCMHVKCLNISGCWTGNSITLCLSALLKFLVELAAEDETMRPHTVNLLEFVNVFTLLISLFMLEFTPLDPERTGSSFSCCFLNICI